MKLVSFVDQFHKSPDCVIPIYSQLSSATFPLFTFSHTHFRRHGGEDDDGNGGGARQWVRYICSFCTAMNEESLQAKKDNMVTVVFVQFLHESSSRDGVGAPMN